MRRLFYLLALSGCMGPWPEVRVVEPIRSASLWTSDTTWVLEGLIYVESGAQLTIEPGTRVLGEAGSALIVTRGARILARGERDEPVVFSSNKAPGSRAAGDWGGLVMLGSAPVNLPDAKIEGVPEGETRANYGGSEPNDPCGTLEYVRIEFAGFEAYRDNELNGLTLGGCGSGTIVRYVQVHRALDDGIEMFGGTADLQNVVISGAQDDSLDWDQGWKGRVQFGIIQQHPGEADAGIEADNLDEDNLAEPRSKPTLSNVTLVGTNLDGSDERGMVLRRGTGARILNSVITGFPQEALDLRDDATIANIEAGDLVIQGVLAHAVGADLVTVTRAEEGEEDDDGGFDEAAWFVAEGNAVVTGEILPRAFDIVAPDFTPAPGSRLSQPAVEVPQGEFWDQGATYFGAVPAISGTEAAWWTGWTAFPEN